MRYRIEAIVQSIDSAFKAKMENDYSVIMTWGVFSAGYVILDVWRGKVEFPRLKQVAVAVWEQWHPMAVLIEDAASGQSLIQELRSHTRMPVIPIKVDKDKVSRANAITPTVEAGKVFMLKGMPWCMVLQHELEVFPSGQFDDQVDAFTQFLNWARIHVVTSTGGLIGVGKKSTWREEQ